jgi:hypothetical protein
LAAPKLADKWIFLSVSIDLTWRRPPRFCLRFLSKGEKVNALYDLLEVMRQALITGLSFNMAI